MQNKENHLEKLSGIVERVTYHNEKNGWSVLRVTSFRDPGKVITVVLHQVKVFAGSSMEFWGKWTQHPKHGEQFKSEKAIEKKPASAAALEKYLGSGLIKGVGPSTAKRIVKHFKERTLDIFENNIEELMSVPGIAEKKLSTIKLSWSEHKAIRDVMIFLQGYGISTLFSVKIYKTYGDKAIEKVSENPYFLARDIYGIGFFSADKIALSMGFEVDGLPRFEAAIKHVLSASREEGHCFLTLDQIINRVVVLIAINLPEKVLCILLLLIQKNEIKKRSIDLKENGTFEDCYYSNSIYFAEAYVTQKVISLLKIKIVTDRNRVKNWIDRYCEKELISLSDEQKNSVSIISENSFSILTGGPGCGKTTSTKVLAKLLLAMGKKITLTAPTGRAAQRMSEVIGLEAKTIHRLLEYAPEKNGFKKDEHDQLSGDFLIVDECSMLDISLAASLLKAVPLSMQVLFIGDPDQLPAVGAGNVLRDLISSKVVPTSHLSKVFRQAAASHIIQYAHQINKGEVPQIPSPVGTPQVLKEKVDCLFLDAEEATKEQARFIGKVRNFLKEKMDKEENVDMLSGEELGNELPFEIPDKFLHVDLNNLYKAKNEVEELKAVLKKIHPWSTINHGLTAVETILRLYTKTIPDALGPDCEIQILSPQIRGSLGTQFLNQQIQNKVNPELPEKTEISSGEKKFRIGDRVIQTRNNYDLGVFNGDIGEVAKIDLQEFVTTVYYPGSEQWCEYSREDLMDLQLAYAITIHKSQGSEFQAVIIPIATQHFKMLFRNLVYTGLTRGKKLVVFVGSRKALSLAIRTIDQSNRQTALRQLLVSGDLLGGIR